MSKKWFEGLTGESILNHFINVKNGIISDARQGYHDDSEKAFDYFKKELKEVIPSIVEFKTPFYMVNNEVYNYWNDILHDIRVVNSELERELTKIYL